MTAGVIIALWVVIMAIVWAWLVRTGEDLAAEPAAADPHAATVEEFRRQLHDWDRGGGDG